MRRLVQPVLVVLVLVLALAVPAAAGAADTQRYILPPGNFGGLPTTTNSLDQLPLYDGLTPLRGNITTADINSPSCRRTSRRSARRTRRTRAGPGCGWSTTRTASRTCTARRARTWPSAPAGPRRATAGCCSRSAAARPAWRSPTCPASTPSAWSRAAESFVPSPQAEALVTKQRKLLVKTYGAKGRQIIADAQAYADGVNAYCKVDRRSTSQPATVNDVIAVTAFIGSIFGAGGGGEASNSDLLAKLQQRARAGARLQGLGRRDAGRRPRGADHDQEALQLPAADRRQGDAARWSSTRARSRPSTRSPPGGPSAARSNAAAAPPRKHASNFLVVSPERSATGNSLAVMGPQLGYYYPEIVQQIDLHGPGHQRAGRGACPGLAMYILIGRTKNYAWSLTSAGHDVRDVFAEKLCEPDGSTPTRASTHYLYKGKCRALQNFNAGTAGRQAAHATTSSVHGPVIGTATVGGKPYALSRKRSTFGRDGAQPGRAEGHDRGQGARTPQKFCDDGQPVRLHVQLGATSRARPPPTSPPGCLPKRAPRPRPPPADARQRRVRVARAS